jgi:uroporphyrinogen-III decarboxylase
MKEHGGMSEEHVIAGALGAERAKRIGDAMRLEQPDRIPLIMSVGYLLADLGGITKQELLEDPENAQLLLEKAALEFQPDSIHGPMPADPIPHLILGDRMTVWPGHGVSVDTQFQFVESEFMKEDEYDAFLDDPTDWVIRTYLPRAFSALGSFASLPPLNLFVSGSYYLGTMGRLASGELADSLRAFAQAVQAVADNTERLKKNHERMVALGFPDPFLAGPTITAPFDMLSDALRGMRGIMMDIIRQPDKLIAAQDRLIRFELDFAIDACKAMGINRTFLPLHRGSDGFMSLKQFETLYWKQLKEVLETLVENGITPIVFYEGCWDQRLEYLADLPKGKTVGMFQASDIFKVKEVVGDTMCIVGGMPNSLLTGGTPQEIRDLTKRLCEEVGKGGGFMMSTAVGELAGSDPALVKVWVDATREYGSY